MKYILPRSGLLVLALVSALPAMAQTVITTTEVQETLPGIVETVVPGSVVQRRTLIQPASSVVRTEITGATLPVLRSNYEKRLSGILDQINLAEQRGWLTSARAEELRKWNSDLVNEERGLRANSNGIVASSDVDMMERHVNGLAYILAKEISSFQVAGKATQTY